MTEIQQLVAIVAIILMTLSFIAYFANQAMTSGSNDRQSPPPQIMTDPIARAQALQVEIDEACRTNLRLGRQTHGIYLALGLLIVGSSALSAILVLRVGDMEANRWLIGSIALVPGICAGVADRFHLVLKKHWYYRKYDRLNTLSRRLRFIIPPVVTEEEIRKLATDLCKIDRDMSRAWELLEEDRPTEKPADKNPPAPPKQKTA